jgi:hypothetical protein
MRELEFTLRCCTAERSGKPRLVAAGEKAPATMPLADVSLRSRMIAACMAGSGTA